MLYFLRCQQLIDEADMQEHSFVLTSLTEPLAWFFFLMDNREAGVAVLIYRGISGCSYCLLRNPDLWNQSLRSASKFSPQLPCDAAAALHASVLQHHFTLLPFASQCVAPKQLLFSNLYNHRVFLHIRTVNTPSFHCARSHSFS